MNFSHLHLHTQYSLLDGASRINTLMKTVKKNGMKAIAITDHGNMFGVPEFVAEANKEGILPIIGCEFYLARGNRFDKTKSEEQDEKNIFHQLLLAKNQTGYKNLSKLCSKGFLEGFYYKPRIDKELLREHHEGLIATTCCIASEINQAILRRGEAEAEKLFQEWLEIFGEDYYIELQRHGIKDQDICNEVLIKWAKKYNVKMIATNDVHYIDMKDSEAQDILLCLQTGKDMDDPKRMRFSGNQFYLKTKEEMAELFKDVPEALDNTEEIISKIEPPKLKRDILLPIFDLPQGFNSGDDYLKHLCFEGAKIKYSELNEEVSTRLDYELEVIKKMGFAGYFLIVQDFIKAAQTLGVAVGPGRGSAAGSAVAYCTGITNIDPIGYNLLFERFLNPERISMPDIDVDFDDEGRDKVIDYVVKKYGKEKVAQIVTFGTMAAKSSIRDVARVLKLPLSEADRLAKLVPERPGTSLATAFKEVPEFADAKKNGSPLVSKTLNLAEVLEDSVRHTGIHASAIIIAPDDLQEHIPLCTAKEKDKENHTDLAVTQYDGSYIESVGMLKMDFLGLKTLTIIRDAIEIIEQNHGVKIDIEKIPLDDEKTYQLYQRGDTIGTFQFESEGMRQYLKDLKPSNIEDLIAMNALYRPGPMDFIPDFINCKHGKKKVEYPHSSLEPILKNTYGIMVYQEQIMQTAQIMADYSLGEADLLRRIMGKKKVELLPPEEKKFVSRAVGKGTDEKKAKEVFDIMARFASYGFNRSHAAAYSVLAYQTAYLKAHYPAEYMSAVLTNNMSNIDKISFFMEACRHGGIAVLGPDVNESNFKFVPNKKGEIRFGLGAVKGVGEGAANAIVQERMKGGAFKNIFDLTQRVNLRSVNKKCLEALAQAGAFDGFKDTHRAQYFNLVPNELLNGIEKAIKFGGTFQDNQSKAQHSLFEDAPAEDMAAPALPDCEKWSTLEQLKKEKEVVGIYLSGHPLDDYKFELTNFCTNSIVDLSELPKFKNREVAIAGMVTEVSHKTTKTGKPFGTFTIEDYTGSHQIALFSEDYLKQKHFLLQGAFLFVRARVELRFNSTDQYQLRVNQMQLLGEVRDKLAKVITLKIGLSDISDEFVEKITSIIKAHPGKCGLKFSILDKEEKFTIDLPSKKVKVGLNNEFIKELDAVVGMGYKMN